MHDTKAVLKDGRVFHGPMYYFRPSEGWFSLMAQREDSGCPEQIYFRDCVSVTTENQRVSISKIETEDELERARKDGWNGT